MVEQPFNLSLEDCAGRLWALTRGAEGREGLWLSDPMNLASQMKFTLRATTSQIGQSIAGWHVDEMETSIPLTLLSTRDTSVWTGWQMLVRGFTPLGTGRIIAGSDNLGKFTCPVRFTRLADPDKSPATPGLQRINFEVDVLSTAGCWYGKPRVLHPESGRDIVLKNNGDFPLWPIVEWRGAQSSIQVVGAGGRIGLPDTKGKLAEIDLDPSVAGRVSINGRVNPELWRLVRGQYISTPIQPHDTATWKFTNCTPILIERYTSMWGGGI